MVWNYDVRNWPLHVFFFSLTPTASGPQACFQGVSAAPLFSRRFPRSRAARLYVLAPPPPLPRMGGGVAC